MNMNWLIDTRIAHRGLHNNLYAENSKSAYEQAISRGLNIEIDVRLTKDGKVVIFHDANLKRVCKENLKVKNLNSHELNNHHLQGTDDTIMLFKDFLNLVDGKVGVLIEIKPVFYYPPLVNKMLDEIKDYKGEYAFQSFSPFVMRMIARKVKDRPLGLLSSDFKGAPMPPITKFLFKRCLLIPAQKLQFVAYDIKAMPSKTVEKLQKKGLKLLNWTINSPEKVELSKKCKADNIIFEIEAYGSHDLKDLPTQGYKE